MSDDHITLIWGMFTNFKEYIKDYKIKVNNEDAFLYIEYLPFAYDLIDADLDFNEEYYQKLWDYFERMLTYHIENAIKSYEISKAEINHKQMIFRDTFETLKTILIERDDDKLKNTTTTSKVMNMHI